MVVYYRGPDPRRPDVVITDRLIKVRVAGGWRIFVIADINDFGVIDRGRVTGWATPATGTSVVLVAFLAYQVRGLALVLVTAIFVVGLILAGIERRRAQSRAPAQLWTTYHGHEIVVLEMPRPHLRAACRGLVRAMEHREDDQ